MANRRWVPSAAVEEFRSGSWKDIPRVDSEWEESKAELMRDLA
jgi:hypothetical protein